MFIIIVVEMNLHPKSQNQGGESLQEKKPVEWVLLGEVEQGSYKSKVHGRRHKERWGQSAAWLRPEGKEPRQEITDLVF